MTELIEELKKWLDGQIITSETIGTIRRQCFVPWDSKWNSIVRDETSQRENKTSSNLQNKSILGFNPDSVPKIHPKPNVTRISLTEMYSKAGGVTVKEKYSEELKNTNEK